MQRSPGGRLPGRTVSEAHVMGSGARMGGGGEIQQLPISTGGD